MKLKNIFLLLTYLVFTKIEAQQIGSWRLHLNYGYSSGIAYSETKILSATKESILVYDTDDHSLRELDKANSLSDIGVSKIAYCEDEKTFVIAYNSTNLDLLTDNFVLTNIPDIKNKVISGSKHINNIYIKGSYAFLSTDIGIIVLDIKNQEIDNTFIIGDLGNYEPVLDCTILNDTIYALTATQGVKTASMLDYNLLDFANWNTTDIPMPGLNIKALEVYDNEVYIIADNDLYKRNTGNWQTVYSVLNHKVFSLTQSEKLMCIIKRDSLGTALKEHFLIIDSEKSDTVLNIIGLDPLELIETKNKEQYLADIAWGLVDVDNNKRLEPSGKPFSSDIYSFSSGSDKVFASPGSLSSGLDALYNINGFYFFKDNRWKNIHRYNTDNLGEVLNFVDVKENPIDKKIYGGTTKGLIEYDYKTVVIYDTLNSLIEKQNTGGDNQYVTGVDFDSKGNVWMVNGRTSAPLKVKDKNGDWFKYTVKTGGIGQKQTGIFVDSYDQIWVRSFRNGIAVYPKIDDLGSNVSGTDILLNTVTANLPHNNVNTIVEDKNGAIWVGTNEGIGVFDCPEDLFDATTDCKISRRIKSTLDEYTEYLFDTDVVRVIAVDGANRKWIGTSTGLWLISESGEDVLQSFNSENSPMPSSEVIALAIDKLTGEVFIGTPLGMVSYVGDATEPAKDVSNVKAFPNPIAPDYFGTISITGLVKNTYVKITDIAGALIHDGYALGGKFVWNGKDYNGRRANSGIYLVFAADNQNANKAVAKIIFVK